MPGVCRLGDKSKALIDVHGCPACPHPNVQGPSIVASANVFVNGSPALRISDMGIHTACCGPNMWEITGASGQVFLNGAQLVRQGDPTKHCGGPGFMIEASGNVQDGSPMVKGMAGANPILNNRAINAAAGQPGGGTNPSALQQIENRAAQFAGELGTEGAKGLGPAGIEAMEKVIDQKVVKFSEKKGIPIPSGAKTAAKALKYGGWAAEFGIGVVPDVVRGDTHDAIKDSVATGAGIAAGGGCEALTGAETFGLSTPACFAVGTGVNWAVGKAYDPVVHTIGHAISGIGEIFH